MKNVEIPINNRTVETVRYNGKFFAQLHGFLRMKKVAKDIARCTLKGPKMSKSKLRKHCSNYLVSKKMTVLQLDKLTLCPVMSFHLCRKD